MEPKIITGDTIISDSDKAIIETGIEALELYQKVLAQLPETQWLALSYANRVIWRQMEEQVEFLQQVVKSGSIPEMGV